MLPFSPFFIPGRSTKLEISMEGGEREREEIPRAFLSPCSKGNVEENRSEMPEMRWGGARIPGQKE